MRRKTSVTALALAGMLAAGNLTAYAAPSISTGIVITDPVTPAASTGGGGSRTSRGGSGGGSGSGIVSRTINRASSLTGGTTNVSATPGATIILDASTPLAAMPSAPTPNVEEVKMAAGTQTNVNGDAIIGNVAVGFVPAETAAAVLPADVVNMMNGINSGMPLETALNTASLAGYHALTGTHTISVTDIATGSATTGTVPLSLYVPNLVEGLNNVSILFYDSTTGNWQLIPVTAMDPVNKTVTVTINGSGVMTVVYQGQNQ